MGVNGNANSSVVLLQDGGTRLSSTSGQWITPLGGSEWRRNLNLILVIV